MVARVLLRNLLGGFQGVAKVFTVFFRHCYLVVMGLTVVAKALLQCSEF